MRIEYKSVYDRTDLKNRIRSKPLTDAEGLGEAYKSQDSTYVNGNTLYMAGTKGNFIGNDWMQNYQYIGLPFVTGQKVHVEQSDRYKQARATYLSHPEVKHLVGHSLGGAVALELKKDNRDLTGRVYGTPYYDPLGMDKIKDTFKEMRRERDDYYKDKFFVEKAVNWVYDREQDVLEKLTGLDQPQSADGIDRYRNVGDLVAMLDNSAKTSIQPNPFQYGTLMHDYHDEASQHSQFMGEGSSNTKVIDSSSFVNPDSDYISIAY